MQAICKFTRVPFPSLRLFLFFSSRHCLSVIMCSTPTQAIQVCFEIKVHLKDKLCNYILHTASIRLMWFVSSFSLPHIYDVLCNTGYCLLQTPWTASTIVLLSIGFVMCRFILAWIAFWRSSSMEWEVNAMIGVQIP